MLPNSFVRFGFCHHFEYVLLNTIVKLPFKVVLLNTVLDIFGLMCLQCEQPVLLNLFIKTNFQHGFGVNGVLDKLHSFSKFETKKQF